MADLKELRAQYIAEVVESYNNKTTAIKHLSRELFLSERTIRRDLDTVSQNQKTRNRI
jgi:DeoR/GlpR family transcriptional regulator of sugar metabolism